MRSNTAAFGSGAAIGTLGGLIGLGGAEFRLPLLISMFNFRGLEAVILNKATSLIVVATALPFRARTVPFAEIALHWPVSSTCWQVALSVHMWGHLGPPPQVRNPLQDHCCFAGLDRWCAVVRARYRSRNCTASDGRILGFRGVAAGFVIGVVASLLGVAGGEFLIPTLILLFGADVKLAGSLSLAVSLPTMLVGFARYSRDQSFSVLRANWPFMLATAAGSMVGTFIGGLLLGLVPSTILLPGLAAILAISAVKIWRHE